MFWSRIEFFAETNFVQGHVLLKMAIKSWIIKSVHKGITNNKFKSEIRITVKLRMNLSKPELC